MRITTGEKWQLVSVVHCCQGPGQHQSYWWLPVAEVPRMLVVDALRRLPCRRCMARGVASEEVEAIRQRVRRELFGGECPPDAAPARKPVKRPA